MGIHTEDRPKCLTELQGKPLLQWQLDAVAAAGLGPVALVTGYLAETLRRFGDQHFENPRWEGTQMVRSLMCARDWLLSHSCIVSYSDIVYERETVEALRNAPGEIVISYHTKWRELWEARFEEPLADAETFRTADDGALLEIGQRAGSIDEIAGQYMGLLKFTPEGWRTVESLLNGLDAILVDRLDITALLSRLISEEVRIDTVAVDGLWLEVDTEADWELYKRMLAER